MFYFIEANARLQVEHTVTEAITGLDLVALQLRIAEGASLADLKLTEAPEPEGFAIQARINMEVLSPKGFFKPSGGTIEHYSPPQGLGSASTVWGMQATRPVRVMTHCLPN